MIDKHLLSDDFGGFDADDADTFALEQLTSYPGNADGFIAPLIQQESLMETVQIPEMEMTEIPAMDYSEVPLMVQNESSDFDEDIAMDDDFIRSLQQELTNKKSMPSTDVPPLVEEQEFVEIDGDPHAEVIDLADIKAEHPSTFTWDESMPEQEEPLPDSQGYGGYGGYASMAQTMTAEEPILTDAPPLISEKQEKKKRFVPSFSKKALLIAATIAGVCVIGLSAYMMTPYISSMFTEHHTDSTLHVASADIHNDGKKSHDSKQHVENKHVDDKAITAISDSLLDEISVDAHTTTEHHSDNTSHQHTQTQESHNNVHTDHPINTKTEHIKASHKHSGHNAIEQKEKKLHTNPSNDKSNGNKMHQQNDSEIKHTKERVKDIEKHTEKKEAQITSTSKEIKQIYTVQVYATPSKSEAERWLQKLRMTSVNSAVITTQLIRDKTWYRVRFGNFASRDEAEKAIRTIGYDQCWIDRVR